MQRQDKLLQDWDDYLSQLKQLQGENKGVYQLGSSNSDRLKVNTSYSFRSYSVQCCPIFSCFSSVEKSPSKRLAIGISDPCLVEVCLTILHKRDPTFENCYYYSLVNQSIGKLKEARDRAAPDDISYYQSLVKKAYDVS